MKKILSMSLLLILAVSFVHAETEVSASNSIDRDKADVLIRQYYEKIYTIGKSVGCGAAGTPVDKGDHWESPVLFGYAGTPTGEAICVDKSSGKTYVRYLKE